MSEQPRSDYARSMRVADAVDELLGSEPPNASPAHNKQLYGNVEASEPAVAEIASDYANNPDAFFNDIKPNLGIAKEGPQHRIVILLKAQGLSNTEIAERMGCSIPWVGQVLRQPWARERLLTEIQRGGRDSVTALIKAAAEDSVFTLIELRDSSPSHPVRCSAATQLLDRFLGKPTQHIESKSEVTHMPAEVDEVNKELAALQKEENRLLGRN